MSKLFLATRRDFLKGSAATAGALTIGFVLPITTRYAQAADQFAPNAFLRLETDGKISVLCGLSEMGQGVHTGIAMLVAEELDADWQQVSVQQAPVDEAYNNPLFGLQGTGGSTSIRGHWEPMRKAGAAARQMLVAAAAAKWQVEPAECRTENARVIHRDGRSLSYGELVSAASGLPLPGEPTLKNPADFRILGKELTRLDTPAKLNGSAEFGLDVRLPGMLVAVMAHAPVPGAKVVSVDDAAAKAIPGVRHVLRIPQGVAVLADGYWPALKGRDALTVRWEDGSLGKLTSAEVSRTLHSAAKQPGAVARDDGDLSAASATQLSASYEVPYLAHACMEPMNCTVWVKGDSAEVWSPSQGPGPHRDIVARLAGVAAEKVDFHTTYLGGGFGRRFAPDFTIPTTLLSKAAGAPVKLVYTREDDMRAWFYRPAAVASFEAGLDDQGKPVSLLARVAAPSIMLAANFVEELPKGIDEPAVEGIQDCPYGIPNLRVEYARTEPGVQVWFWRSVGHSQNAFFLESFIDEMAAAAGKDPVAYRRELLAEQPRLRAALDLAAEKAGWGNVLPSDVHRGVAVASSFGSHVAQVAEVSVSSAGQIRVHRIVAAVDCGRTVNPAIIRRQIEGATVYGLSAALYEQITFKNGRVEQGNFDDFPILRMNEMPKVEVHIVPSTENPGGIGEPGLPPATPAVMNAVYAATGKRIRRLPVQASELARA